MKTISLCFPLPTTDVRTPYTNASHALSVFSTFQRPQHKNQNSKKNYVDIITRVRSTYSLRPLSSCKINISLVFHLFVKFLQKNSQETTNLDAWKKSSMSFAINRERNGKLN